LAQAFHTQKQTHHPLWLCTELNLRAIACNSNAMKQCCWFAGLIIAAVALDFCARGSSVHDVHAENSCGSSCAGVDDDVTMLQVMTQHKSRSDLHRTTKPDVEVSPADEQEGGKQQVAQEDATIAPGLPEKLPEEVAGRQNSRGTVGRQARQNERRRNRKIRPLSPPPVNWVQDWATDPKLKDFTLVLDHPFHANLGALRGDVAEPSYDQVLACCGFTIGMCAIGWFIHQSFCRGDQEAPMLKLLILCSSFGICSWGMTVVNKSLVAATNTPTLVAAAQMFMTVVGLYLFARDNLMGSKEAVTKWLVVPFLSSGMLVMSFLTYGYLSFATLIIIRTLGPLIAAPIESVIMAGERRPHISGQTVAALLTCILSAALYCGKTTNVSPEGFGFALLNLALAIGERLMICRLLTDECKALSTESCMYLNNFVGMLPALILGACLGEFGRVDKQVWFGSVTTVLLLISGVIASGVCYLALTLQREIHATSFMVLENAVRMAVIAAGVLIFFHPIGWPLQVLGLLFSFVGALWYGKSQMDALSAKQKALADKLSTPRDLQAALFLAGAREPLPSDWRNGSRDWRNVF